jgi:hypothetical protein
VHTVAHELLHVDGGYGGRCGCFSCTLADCRWSMRPGGVVRMSIPSACCSSRSSPTH